MFVLIYYVYLAVRWFCNGCWGAWEEERKEQRLTTGKLFPEDRELSYARTRPIELYDYEDEFRFKVSLAEQYVSDLSWFKVDISSLCISTFSDDSETLNWKKTTNDEFVMDFFFLPVHVEKIGSIFDHSRIHFPGKLLLNDKLRRVAREKRAYKLAKKRELAIQTAQREEAKKQQQFELAQKQKEMVQLALKRAQKQQKPQINNAWSSQPAVPPPRPMMPAPMPGWSSFMTAPPVTFRAAMLPPDPWSVTQPAVTPAQPDAKRIKTPPSPAENSEAERQRMARLGVPFR